MFAPGAVLASAEGNVCLWSVVLKPEKMCKTWFCGALAGGQVGGGAVVVVEPRATGLYGGGHAGPRASAWAAWPPRGCGPPPLTQHSEQLLISIQMYHVWVTSGAESQNVQYVPFDIWTSYIACKH